eukprot:1160446-Pelagomonas_calceolata.AAC.2
MGEGVHACGHGFCVQASPVHAQPHDRGHLGAARRGQVMADGKGLQSGRLITSLTARHSFCCKAMDYRWGRPPVRTSDR